MNSILFADETGGRARIIVVTSPELGDGKTTVSSNLAISLAQIRNRVLLIDGDLRKPRLTSVFDMLKEPGLVELLRGDRPITPTDVNEFIHETCVPDLYILPSGDRRAFDSKLLHSQRMRDLDRHLRATAWLRMAHMCWARS
jgi:Mrp family chromosome partitioning ATPase